jgi:putative SOS response-associated peptidase YedK
MCGRYGLYDVSFDELLKENSGYEFKPNYNAAPTQTMPILLLRDLNMAITPMQWGISRRIGPEVEKSIFNTRSEKALDRIWGRTVKTHRCLVPANGFYEWRKVDGAKIPYWIYDKDSPLMYFAGIYDEDANQNEKSLRYSIMTTTPNAEMSTLHDRMPVILSKDGQQAWLHAESSDSDLLADLLRPLPDHSLEMYEVSKDVNVVKNNNGELMKPLNSK